jgi:hypothetical protein
LLGILGSFRLITRQGVDSGQRIGDFYL